MKHGRSGITGAALVAAGLALTACGGGGSSAGSETTAAPNTTPWRTLPPVANTDPGTAVGIEGGVVSYTVQRGDYYVAIAKKAGGGCSGTDLQDFNPEVDFLVPGITVKIPASCLAAGVTEETLNAADVADDTATDGGAADTTEPTTTIAEFNEYIVVKGDYAFGIVKKTGCSYNELKKANPGKMSNLRPKMKLKVPVSCDTRDLSTGSGG